jgi:hypothetical protein
MAFAYWFSWALCDAGGMEQLERKYAGMSREQMSRAASALIAKNAHCWTKIVDELVYLRDAMKMQAEAERGDE